MDDVAEAPRPVAWRKCYHRVRFVLVHDMLGWKVEECFGRACAYVCVCVCARI